MTSKEKIKVLWQCVGSPWAATDDPSTCRECLLSGGGSVKKYIVKLVWGLLVFVMLLAQKTSSNIPSV